MKSNNWLWLIGGAVAAYFLLPEKVKESVTSGLGGGSTSFDLKGLFEGFKMPEIDLPINLSILEGLSGGVLGGGGGLAEGGEKVVDILQKFIDEWDKKITDFTIPTLPTLPTSPTTPTPPRLPDVSGGGNWVNRWSNMITHWQDVIPHWDLFGEAIDLTDRSKQILRTGKPYKEPSGIKALIQPTLNSVTLANTRDKTALVANPAMYGNNLNIYSLRESENNKVSLTEPVTSPPQSATPSEKSLPGVSEAWRSAWQGVGHYY